MQNKFHKANTQKNEYRLLTKEAELVLHIGMGMILLSLVRLMYDILHAAPFPTAIAEDYGAMLEYPVAALMLLTVLAFLLDRVTRAEYTPKP